MFKRDCCEANLHRDLWRESIEKVERLEDELAVARRDVQFYQQARLLDYQAGFIAGWKAHEENDWKLLEQHTESIRSTLYDTQQMLMGWVLGGFDGKPNLDLAAMRDSVSRKDNESED